MHSIYDAATRAHCEEMSKRGVEFVPFSVWLERMKKAGKYWAA